jgi:hypothetical protein
VSKYTSYYDWELQFRRAKKRHTRERKNPLGLYHHQFEAFLKDWKKKNFPVKEPKDT